jgi:hypothetical protein
MAKGISYTEMKARDFANMIRDDLKEEIEVQLNGFVRSVVNDLSNKGMFTKKGGVSPVLTGFFASSWKASVNRINRKDKRESFPRWARIKYKGNKLLPGYRPLLEQRHAVPTDFKINQSVFIGNTAKYAPDAVLSPKSQIFAYLADGSGTFAEGLTYKIDRFFTDKKRPDIRVGGDVDDANRISYLKL